VPAACGRIRDGPQRVVDRYRLWRDGGHALVLRPGRIEIGTVRADRGDRPWTRRAADTR
jgi:competence protein ComEC